MRAATGQTNVVFILNKKAGGGAFGGTWRTIENGIAAHFDSYVVRESLYNGHSVDLSREAVEGNCQLIVACGGDGTASQVCNGYIQGNGRQRGVLLGIIALGTGGDFIKSFNIPSDPLSALKCISRKKYRTIDAGYCKYTMRDPSPANDTKTVFWINVASFGISGVITHAVENSPLTKWLSGSIAYWYHTFIQTLFWRDRAVDLEIELSESCPNSSDTTEIVTERRRANVYITAICNARVFGGGMIISPESNPEDGLLDMVLLEDISKWLVITKAVNALKKGCLKAIVPPARIHSEPDESSKDGSIRKVAKIDRRSAITTSKCIKLTATPVDHGRPVGIEIDGEPLGILPATYGVVPEAINLIVP